MRGATHKHTPRHDTKLFCVFNSSPKGLGARARNIDISDTTPSLSSLSRARQPHSIPARPRPNGAAVKRLRTLNIGHRPARAEKERGRGRETDKSRRESKTAMGRAMGTLPARVADDSTTTSRSTRRRRRRPSWSSLHGLLLPLLLTATTITAAATAPTPPDEPPRPAASSLARRRGPPLAIPPGLGQDNVHTVFLTDCTAYSDWQTLTLIFSWRESGQPGPLTRVMCCTPEEAARYSGAMLSLVPTHVAPSLTKNPHNNDTYAAYNKPGAIIDWLAHFTPREEFLLVMDSDMILRHPFLPGRFPMVRPGWAASGKYDYLAGVYNELADTFVPNVVPRDDELAGPKGRRADQVGGFFFTRVDDIRKVSTEWLSLSEAVRFDPTVRSRSVTRGDTDAPPSPWPRA